MRKLCFASGLFLAGIGAMAVTFNQAGGQSEAPAAGQPAPGGGAISISAPAGEGSATISAGGITLVAPPPAYGGGGYGSPGGFGGMAVEWTEHDEEMQKLMQADAEQEGHVQEAVNAYSDPSADSDARAEARSKLASALEAQFTARQQRRELEIRQIEDRVKKLREALDKRASAKDKIIERRINDLLTEAEGLGWGDAGPGNNFYRSSPYGGNPNGGRPGGSPYGGGGRGSAFGGRGGGGNSRPAPRSAGEADGEGIGAGRGGGPAPTPPRP